MSWASRDITVALLLWSSYICRAAPQQALPSDIRRLAQCQPINLVPQQVGSTLQCTANVASAFSLTSPLDFAGNPQQFAVGQGQIVDPLRSTIWLPSSPTMPSNATTTNIGVPKQQQQQTMQTMIPAASQFPPGSPLQPEMQACGVPLSEREPSSDTPRTIAVGFNENTPVTFTVPKSSVVSISWIVQQTAPWLFLKQGSTSPDSPGQLSGQVQKEQNLYTGYGITFPSCPLPLIVQQRNAVPLSQSQNQQQSNIGVPFLAFPKRIFNPASISLVDAQGRVLNGARQLSWHMAQPTALEMQGTPPPARGAVNVYLCESLPNGIYAFLVTGQLQDINSTGAAGSLPSVPTLYGMGPECSFLSHPFRITDIPGTVQTAWPTPAAPTPAIAPVQPDVTPPAVTQVTQRPEATNQQQYTGVILPAPQATGAEQPRLPQPAGPWATQPIDTQQSPQPIGADQPQLTQPAAPQRTGETPAQQQYPGSPRAMPQATGAPPAGPQFAEPNKAPEQQQNIGTPYTESPVTTPQAAGGEQPAMTQPAEPQMTLRGQTTIT